MERRSPPLIAKQSKIPVKNSKQIIYVCPKCSCHKGVNPGGRFATKQKTTTQYGSKPILCQNCNCPMAAMSPSQFTGNQKPKPTIPSKKNQTIRVCLECDCKGVCPKQCEYIKNLSKSKIPLPTKTSKLKSNVEENCECKQDFTGKSNINKKEKKAYEKNVSISNGVLDEDYVEENEIVISTTKIITDDCNLICKKKCVPVPYKPPPPGSTVTISSSSISRSGKSSPKQISRSTSASSGTCGEISSDAFLTCASYCKSLLLESFANSPTLSVRSISSRSSKGKVPCHAKRKSSKVGPMGKMSGVKVVTTPFYSPITVLTTKASSCSSSGSSKGRGSEICLCSEEDLIPDISTSSGAKASVGSRIKSMFFGSREPKVKIQEKGSKKAKSPEKAVVSENPSFKDGLTAPVSSRSTQGEEERETLISIEVFAAQGIVPFSPPESPALDEEQPPVSEEVARLSQAEKGSAPALVEMVAASLSQEEKVTNSLPEEEKVPPPPEEEKEPTPPPEEEKAPTPPPEEEKEKAHTPPPEEEKAPTPPPEEEKEKAHTPPPEEEKAPTPPPEEPPEEAKTSIPPQEEEKENALTSPSVEGKVPTPPPEEEKVASTPSGEEPLARQPSSEPPKEKSLLETTLPEEEPISFLADESALPLDTSIQDSQNISKQRTTEEAISIESTVEIKVCECKSGICVDACMLQKVKLQEETDKMKINSNEETLGNKSEIEESLPLQENNPQEIEAFDVNSKEETLENKSEIEESLPLQENKPQEIEAFDINSKEEIVEHKSEIEVEPQETDAFLTTEEATEGEAIQEKVESDEEDHFEEAREELNVPVWLKKQCSCEGPCHPECKKYEEILELTCVCSTTANLSESQILERNQKCTCYQFSSGALCSYCKTRGSAEMIGVVEQEQEISDLDQTEKTSILDVEVVSELQVDEEVASVDEQVASIVEEITSIEEPVASAEGEVLSAEVEVVSTEVEVVSTEGEVTHTVNEVETMETETLSVQEENVTLEVEPISEEGVSEEETAPQVTFVEEEVTVTAEESSPVEENVISEEDQDVTTVSEEKIQEDLQDVCIPTCQSSCNEATPAFERTVCDNCQCIFICPPGCKSTPIFCPSCVCLPGVICKVSESSIIKPTCKCEVCDDICRCNPRVRCSLDCFTKRMRQNCKRLKNLKKKTRYSGDDDDDDDDGCADCRCEAYIQQVESAIDNIECACEEAEAISKRKISFIPKLSRITNFHYTVENIMNRCNFSDNFKDETYNKHTLAEKIKKCRLPSMIEDVKNMKYGGFINSIFHSIPSDRNSSGIASPEAQTKVIKILDIRKLGCRTLMITWSCSDSSTLIGYEILVNGVVWSRVCKAKTATVLEDIDMTYSLVIRVFAVTESGRLRPGAVAIYQM